MNILKLEKLGMDFNPNDERVSGSDVGNYRVSTGDYTVRAKDGKTNYLDLMRTDAYTRRTLNKRTGKPLKNPVRELVATNIVGIWCAYLDENGVAWGNGTLECDIYGSHFPYTVSGILAAVNSFAAVPYDGIEFVERV